MLLLTFGETYRPARGHLWQAKHFFYDFLMAPSEHISFEYYFSVCVCRLDLLKKRPKLEFLGGGFKKLIIL